MSCIRVRPNALALPLGSLQSKESSNPLALRTAGGAPHTWFLGLFVGGYNHTRGVLRPAKNRGGARVESYAKQYSSKVPFPGRGAQNTRLGLCGVP
jgi:hypothetical protein